MNIRPSPPPQGLIGLILFDLDGTLIDSKVDIIASVNHSLVESGRSAFSPEAVGKCIGRGIYNLFKQLVGEQTPLEELEALVTGFRDAYATHMQDQTQIFPGILDALRFYAHLPKVVITNKSQVSADQVVDAMGLRSHFEGIFGSDAFATQKPDPGPVLEICKKWQLAPSRAALVGDTLVDMNAGKGAGVSTVAALYGYGDRAALQRFKPDFEIDSPSEIIGLF